MQFDNLTREQAIEIVGEEAVKAVDNVNCEPTSRKIDGDEPPVEFAASINCTDKNGEPTRLTAIYFQSHEAMEEAAEKYDGDLSSLDWEVDHYRVS